MKAQSPSAVNIRYDLGRFFSKAKSTVEELIDSSFHAILVRPIFRQPHSPVC